MFHGGQNAESAEVCSRPNHSAARSIYR